METRRNPNPSSPSLHRLIGHALVDRRFREALLRRPWEAIREYPFSREERERIASLKAETLEEFSRMLDETSETGGS